MFRALQEHSVGPASKAQLLDLFCTATRGNWIVPLHWIQNDNALLCSVPLRVHLGITRKADCSTPALIRRECFGRHQLIRNYRLKASRWCRAINQTMASQNLSFRQPSPQLEKHKPAAGKVPGTQDHHSETFPRSWRIKSEGSRRRTSLLHLFLLCTTSRGTDRLAISFQGNLCVK